MLAAVFAGCSAKGSEDGANADMAPGYSGGYGYNNDNSASAPGKPEDGSPEVGDGEASGIAAGAVDRKRIQYVTVDMETLEYDTAAAKLKSMAAEAGGYIDSSRETGLSVSGRGTRRSEFVFRIPTGELDGFTAKVAELGNVLSQYTTTDDVTEKYFDTEARLAALKLERDKYMELLDRADNMDYIISLTNALSEVNYQIELYTGTLNKYDSLIAYSTVTVKLANAFSGSLEAFSLMCQTIIIGLTAALPFLIIPAAAVIIVVVIVVRRSKKRRRAALEASKKDD